MARGGKREGSGRKADPTKDARLGAERALKLLKELKAEQELKTLFMSCGDARLKAHIIFRLMEWAYDKPAQALAVGGPDGGPIQHEHYVVEKSGAVKRC